MTACWTVADVARRARVSHRTVQRWVKLKHGPLPARRVGKTLRFEPAEFEAWWASKTTAKPAAPPARNKRLAPAPIEGNGPWPHPEAESLRHIA